MIKMIYSIKTEDREVEIKWLREQKIYPACDEVYDWTTCKYVTKVGVIVRPEMALLIKLRHNLDSQHQWVNDR